MAHELDFTTGKAGIALKGGKETAWHKMGQEILATDSVRDIQKKAGLDWEVKQAPVSFTDDTGKVHEFGGRLVNYRSDTGGPLGIVAPVWKKVQPVEIMDFFDKFLKEEKLSIETAGSLRGGRIIWCMAKLGPEYGFMMPGKDKIDAYVRLQTGFAGDTATDLVATTTRQVCANTMAMVDRDAINNGYNIPHSSEFDAKALQKAFGFLGEQHKLTAKVWNALCARKVTTAERDQYFCELFGFEVDDLTAIDKKTKKPVMSSRSKNMIAELTAAFANAPGSALKSAAGTAFGLLQAVTYWTDHQSTVRDQGEGKDEARAAANWFGMGKRTKDMAQYMAAELAGCTELLDGVETKVAVAA